MKHSAKRLLSVLVALAMTLSLLPGLALAAQEEVPVAEGTASFATNTAAFNGKSVYFTPETNGDITVEILSCTPGYYVDIYEDGEWIEDHAGTAADTVTFSVTGGFEYEILLCSYNASNPNLGYAQAGSLSYKITFVSNGELPGGDDDEPEDPALLPGATEENPKLITGSDWTFIGAGKTVYYLYDNTRNMTENGVYSMILHINSSADYSVTYAGADVPVDENGFINYEMEDTAKEGLYRFSITNNSAEEKFFGVEVRERPVYVNSGITLVVGRNSITLDDTATYTLCEFSPSRTGIYQIQVDRGVVGNWGTAYNPVDNTPDKTDTLIWICTAVGQSVMVGFTGSETTTCTINRTGDYIPPEEIPWTVYELTYDFSYRLDQDAQIQDVDLTDGAVHTAVLGEDGFYHYGSAEGPLMVTDLSTVEINLADAYINGGLRAWLMDENNVTISKIDYNEAMNTYYQAGLVPVTQELAVMLQQIGQANGWWVTNGIIFTETAPENLSVAWMQLCGYLVEQGVILTGTVETGAEGDTTLELIVDGETVDTVIAADGTYRMENIGEGSYTLKISMENHVSREYTVTVGKEDLTVDVKIHLIGDVDGSGKVNIGDVAKIKAHISGTGAITDPYQLLCANVNGGSLNMGDVSALYSHIRGTKTLY